MRLVMTGAGGMLGTELTNRLSLYDVPIFQVPSSSFLDPSNEMSKTRLLHRLEAFSQGQAIHVVHAAYARKNESAAIARSISFLHQFFGAIAPLEIGGVLHVSSQSVYDPYRSSPALESDVPAPRNLYAQGKLFSEKWLEKWASEMGVPLLQLRLASLIGAPYPERIITRLMTRAYHEGKIEIMMGDARFSYLDYRDAVEGIVRAVLKTSWLTGTYNLGTHERFSIAEIAEAIQKILADHYGKTVEIETTPATPPYFSNVIDPKRFEIDFGWRAKRSLNAYLEELVNEMGIVNES